jgi:hypothetical protein
MNAPQLLRDTLEIINTELGMLKNRVAFNPLNTDDAAKLCAYGRLLTQVNKKDLPDEGEDFSITSMSDLKRALKEITLDD